MHVKKILFRAYPSYITDIKHKKSSVWYDWCYINHENKKLPAQLLCFFKLTEINILETEELEINDNINLNNNSYYAIVRIFEDEPGPIRTSHDGKSDYCFLITHGKLREGLFLINCKNITEEIAVVPNIPALDEKNETLIESKKGFLVVSNKDEWKDYFSKYICMF